MKFVRSDYMVYSAIYSWCGSRGEGFHFQGAAGNLGTYNNTALPVRMRGIPEVVKGGVVAPQLEDCFFLHSAETGRSEGSDEQSGRK